MGKKATPGLYKRGKYWHIKKTICGVNIFESTRTSSLVDAELYLAKRVKEVLNYIQFGERPKKIFAEGAARYLLENKHKPSIKDDATHLEKLMQFIGDTELEKINNQTLQPFIEHRKEEGVKNKTINLALSVVRRILNLSASDWVDEQGKTWLAGAPKIKMLKLDDQKPPHPITMDEQERLFDLLAPHLHDMCLFKVNTGTREHEVCQLQWDWEVKIPQLNTYVFVIPGQIVKNRGDRLVILNDIAKEVIEKRRGINQKYVFTYKGNKVGKINNSGWKRAIMDAKLKGVRVHDLKHTFGQRLRANGVHMDDIQDLLGHKSRRITRHYCAPDIQRLIDCANRVCNTDSQQPLVTLIRLDTKKSIVAKS